MTSVIRSVVVFGYEEAAEPAAQKSDPEQEEADKQGDG